VSEESPATLGVSHGDNSPVSSDANGWVQEYYAALDRASVDGARLGEWIDLHTEDVAVVLRTNAPFVGKEELHKVFANILANLGAWDHRVVRTVSDGETTMAELEVDRTAPDGQFTQVRSAVAFHRRGELIDQLRVYS
jgi:hypothetical protein